MYRAAIAGSLALIAAIGVLWVYAFQPLALDRLPYAFYLKHGSSLASVADQLAAQKVIGSPRAFEWLVRLHAKAADVRAGSYVLLTQTTPLELYRVITHSENSQGSVTLRPGWTMRRLLRALDENVLLDGSAVNEQELTAQLNVPYPSLEGLLLPDEYHFPPHYAKVDVIRRAYHAMQKELDSAWQARTANRVIKTPYQALILASIVEKETARPEERALIAGVFLNRLEQGMRLQTDPTVMYGLRATLNGRLTKADLQTDTPYNTYTRYGLPPTPIAMPSRESLRAALHPDATDALYFVSKGDGSHQFSRTIQEHNAAVEKYIKGGGP